MDKILKNIDKEITAFVHARRHLEKMLDIHEAQIEGLEDEIARLKEATRRGNQGEEIMKINDARFVQIAASPGGDINHDILYGLDNNGYIWVVVNPLEGEWKCICPPDSHY